jgi:hypothetical protein
LPGRGPGRRIPIPSLFPPTYENARIGSFGDGAHRGFRQRVKPDPEPHLQSSGGLRSAVRRHTNPIWAFRADADPDAVTDSDPYAYAQPDAITDANPFTDTFAAAAHRRRARRPLLSALAGTQRIHDFLTDANGHADAARMGKDPYAQPDANTQPASANRWRECSLWHGAHAQPDANPFTAAAG